VCAISTKSLQCVPKYTSLGFWKLDYEFCSRLEAEFDILELSVAEYYPTSLLPFFICTINNDIAAGVIPGSLEARAKLSGLASVSFCFTSFESPTTFE
jgi:hypothetical protein